MNERDIEALVAAVLAEMSDKKADCSCNKECSHKEAPVVGSTAKVAMLTGEKKIEVKEFPIPAIGDDEILVKVEGCGVCGTDVHEWKGDPFGLIPAVLGHEGSGEIVAIGKNIKVDTTGNPIGVGDKIVTSVLACGTCPMCLSHPELPQLCENQGVYGLIPDSEDKHLNGWFANYLVIRKGSTFFNVNGMSLDQRMLIELCAVAVHAVERAQKANIMNFNSNILVQGCGPVGQVVIAVLKTYGYRNIFALDGNDARLETARSMGAVETINFKTLNTLEARTNFVNARTKQLGVDFAFQCTGV
ncbi:MAG: alcohol dehydrogenase catalytic domain-containing protein, partial [Carnobacterium sp.]